MKKATINGFSTGLDVVLIGCQCISRNGYCVHWDTQIKGKAVIGPGTVFVIGRTTLELMSS